MRKTLCLVLLTLFQLVAFSQSNSYGKQLTDSLCKPFFFGRGYVNDGVIKAGFYIFRNFDSLKLQPFNTNFYQEFALDVNTFPGKVKLSINGKNLNPGIDFLPLPESGSSKGRYTLYELALDTFSITELSKITPIPKTALLLKGKALNNSKAAIQQLIAKWSAVNPVILATNQKLTWSVAPYQLANAVCTVKEEFLISASKINIYIDTYLEKNYYNSNVAAYVKGTEYPDSFLVFTAHYDHLGALGEDLFIPGANDNASGTAMLLSLAAYFKQNPQKYSIAFIAFAGEEIGLLGSKYFVEHPLIPLKSIKFLLNLDLMGTGKDGATLVNATKEPLFFNRLKQINASDHYLTSLNERDNAANSDHYWFTQKGVPAMFMYLLDSEYTYYHELNDSFNKLPLSKFDATQDLLIAFFKSLSNDYPRAAAIANPIPEPVKPETKSNVKTHSRPKSNR